MTDGKLLTLKTVLDIIGDYFDLETNDTARACVRTISTKAAIRPENRKRDDHSGTPVTWERLRTAHSAMLGEKVWAPDAPNEGRRIYRQSAGEQCYLCAALWLIDEARKENESLESDRDTLRKALEEIIEEFAGAKWEPLLSKLRALILPSTTDNKQ